jgi:uncharacterized protein YaaQ
MTKKSPVNKNISGVQQKEKPAEPKQKNIPKLKLVFFIVDWHYANTVSDVCAEEKVRFHFTSLGKGTASSEALDLLGIGSSEKAVIICLEQEIGVTNLMKEVRKKLKNLGPGAGIAFTVPLSAINDPILLIFKQSILKNKNIAAANQKSEGENMANKFSHDLIISVVNQGFSDELMNTAREAGATGGTVIHSRGTAHSGAVKFFGVSVQDEKELILILTSRKTKAAIMQAICQAHGLNSSAQGIVFSVPVDSVMGLSIE